MYMAHERRQYIIRLLEQRGSIRSAALAQELGVTDETIRTDFVALQKKGLLKRVHGGAEYIVPTQASGATADAGAESAMAALVAAHIPAGACIYADACHFTRVLAAQLADKPCTFITPSLQLSLHLAPKVLPHTVICTGGQVDKDCKLCCGEQAEQALSQARPQFAVLRPAGLSPTQAFYTHALQAHWATLATACAEHCLVAVPAAVLTATTVHATQLPPYQLVTEDNLPPGFEGIPTQTIPYISAESLLPSELY